MGWTCGRPGPSWSSGCAEERSHTPGGDKSQSERLSGFAGPARPSAGRGAAAAWAAALRLAESPRALQQGYWMARGVLAALALSAVIVPLADAAVSRRAELGADRFAADHGLAGELAAAPGL